jgi:hypothetical protein
MRTILKGVVILCVFTMALTLITVPRTMAADTETFVNKSPDFTLTVPKWTKSKSLNTASVLREAMDPLEITTFDATVSDLPEGQAYKDLAKDMIDYLVDKYKATNCTTLYEKEIKLLDGTPAYELEVKWNHPAILLYTYQVTVFKDKKNISVSVTSNDPIRDELKKIPLSLSFK